MGNHVKESDLVAKIKRLVIARGGVPVKHHGGAFSQAGVSDLLVCYRGRFVAMEAKMPGNKATPLQADFITRITDSGGVAGVVYTVPEAAALLDSIDAELTGCQATTTR